MRAAQMRIPLQDGRQQNSVATGDVPDGANAPKLPARRAILHLCYASAMLLNELILFVCVKDVRSDFPSLAEFLPSNDVLSRHRHGITLSVV